MNKIVCNAPLLIIEQLDDIRYFLRQGVPYVKESTNYFHFRYVSNKFLVLLQKTYAQKTYTQPKKLSIPIIFRRYYGIGRSKR